METTSANRTIRPRPRQAARCTGGNAEQTTFSPAASAADGFLRHSFLQMYQPAEVLPERKATERDFFKSLSFLKKHYGMDITNLRSLPYPYNILSAEKEVNKKLKVKNRYRELLITEQEDGRNCLSVKESFARDFGLYYIPMMPLYQLWKNRAQKKCAELLTAVCAYLYIKAGVEHYRDGDNYMAYTYDILKDWIEDDKDSLDKAEYRAKKKALKAAEIQGDFIKEKMLQKDTLTGFEALANAFIPKSTYETACLELGKKTLKLSAAYPHNHLYLHCSEPVTDENEDDYYRDDNIIRMTEYISFIGSGDDALCDDVFSMVNTDFNERPSFQEPELVTHFNEPKGKYADDLNYEFEVFGIIDDLCTLLYKKP
jgi:hypothetical protein